MLVPENVAIKQSIERLEREMREKGVEPSKIEQEPPRSCGDPRVLGGNRTPSLSESELDKKIKAIQEESRREKLRNEA